MDSVFGSQKLNRKRLEVNPNRRTRKQEFSFNTNLGYKSKAEPSVVSWASRGKGVQGESVNSQNNASKFIINKNWKPV
jgi:hypothetical protein